MTNIQILESKIKELSNDLSNVDGQIVSIQSTIGEFMRQPSPDESKVDEIQHGREQLVRKKERIEIKLQAAKEQRPLIRKKDAEVKVYALADELKEYSKQAAESVPVLEKAIDEVINVAEGAYQPYINSLPISSDIEILCLQHGIPRPAKSTVRQIAPGKMEGLVTYFAKLDREFKAALRDERRRYADKLAALKK